jgi:hypothetical protein
MAKKILTEQAFHRKNKSKCFYENLLVLNLSEANLDGNENLSQ